MGCQMNEHDSEVMAALLENTGYRAAAAVEEADLIIINTCAVRKKPEDKVASLLGKYRVLKEANQELLLAVGGCMSQQEESARYLKSRFPWLDLVFGTHALPRLPALIAEARESGQTVVDISEDYPDREGLPVKQGSYFQAWLPVAYGCNNFCSYCVVPLVRGRERSRPAAEIVAEAAALVEQGYLQVTLLGQNVNSYGRDLPGEPNFAGLLSSLNRLAGLERIRFMTSHPKDLSRELIETVRDGEKICEHFHLPVQSGSDRILKLMNRSYDREHYLGLVREIHRAIPEAVLTSDIIVGFPGETEEDFSQTIGLVEEARFDNVFSFVYSPRRNTAAAKMADSLSYRQKERRLQSLNAIQQRISLEKNLAMVGRDVELLGEGPSKNNPLMQTGRTRGNKLVHFPSPGDLSGKVVRVKVIEARTWNLSGELPRGAAGQIGTPAGCAGQEL